MLMPWDIRQRGSQYQVVQRDNGKIVGTHPTRNQAQAQQAALYATEDDQKKSNETTKGTWMGRFMPRKM
jgi:hypothetical protein